MIYLDTSVALAELFAEDRRPAPSIWAAPLVCSRLLEHELWNRIHHRGALETHGEAARELVSRLAFVELSSQVLARALEAWPTKLRTLDALHLATALFLRERRQVVEFATYDAHLAQAAKAVGLKVIAP